MRPIDRIAELLLQALQCPDPEESSATRASAPRSKRAAGHYHAIFGARARLMRYRDDAARVVAVVDGGGEVRVVGGGSGGVDRHTPISLAPGRYEVRIQRSFSAGFSRRVAD